MTFARPPAVAGAFYPADPAQLRHNIQAYLDAAVDVSSLPPPPPKALIVPHAGYVYSGPIAAHAYATLLPLKNRIERVVLLGPCHRVAVQGLALSNATSFTTPLGDVPVDHSLDQTVLACPHVSAYDAPHTLEHSLEVQLPFLQVVLGDFKVLPLVVGVATPAHIADVLKCVWGGAETVIVISSDLSHYLDHAAARALDQQTCAAIEALNGDAIKDDQACGRYPVKGLLTLAKDRDMSIRTLDLRTSGDTAGDRDHVVGYGAWALWEKSP